MSGGWDGTAKIWDVATGKVTKTLDGHAHAVTVLALPGDKIFTGSQDGFVHIW